MTQEVTKPVAAPKVEAPKPAGPPAPMSYAAGATYHPILS